MKIPRLPATPRIISLQLQGNRKFTTQPFLLFMFLIVISINQHIKANMHVICDKSCLQKNPMKKNLKSCRPSLNFCTLIFAKVPMVMYTRQEIVIGVDIGATLVLQSVGCKILLAPSDQDKKVSLIFERREYDFGGSDI